MPSLSSLLNQASTFVRKLSIDSKGDSDSTPGGTYCFPPDVGDYNRMFIRGNSEGLEEIKIYLQIPQGFAVGDTIGYSSMNLGQIGEAAQNALTEANDALKNGGSPKAVLDALVGAAKNTANEVSSNLNQVPTTVRAAALAQIGNKAGVVPSGIITAAAEANMYNMKSVLNPNQRTTFTGTGVRSFTFQFKLVSTSKKEAKTVKDMIDNLRLHAYPAGNDIVLEYPSEFDIKFLKAKSSDINPYISPIYKCYLMSISTTYNSSSNAFYEDGAPLEVDVSLSFQETKALTRDDIAKLAKEQK